MTELTRLVAEQIVEDKFDVCQECPKMKKFMEDAQKLFNEYIEKFDEDDENTYTFWDFCCDKENEICGECELFESS
jgi:hypothetical protein